jgi:hypothetical protein
MLQEHPNRYCAKLRLGPSHRRQIMSAEEQSLALELMNYREQAQAKMAEMGIDKVRAFTEKMRRVTSGCADKSQSST